MAGSRRGQSCGLLFRTDFRGSSGGTGPAASLSRIGRRHGRPTHRWRWGTRNGAGRTAQSLHRRWGGYLLFGYGRPARPHPSDAPTRASYAGEQGRRSEQRAINERSPAFRRTHHLKTRSVGRSSPLRLSRPPHPAPSRKSTRAVAASGPPRRRRRNSDSNRRLRRAGRSGTASGDDRGFISQQPAPSPTVGQARQSTTHERRSSCREGAPCDRPGDLGRIHDVGSSRSRHLRCLGLPSAERIRRPRRRMATRGSREQSLLGRNERHGGGILTSQMPAGTFAGWMFGAPEGLTIRYYTLYRSARVSHSTGSSLVYGLYHDVPVFKPGVNTFETCIPYWQQCTQIGDPAAAYPLDPDNAVSRSGLSIRRIFLRISCGGPGETAPCVPRLQVEASSSGDRVLVWRTTRHGTWHTRRRAGHDGAFSRGRRRSKYRRPMQAAG